MELHIKCPCCSEELTILVNGETITVSPPIFSVDENEVREFLSNSNIEFG